EEGKDRAGAGPEEERGQGQYPDQTVHRVARGRCGSRVAHRPSSCSVDASGRVDRRGHVVTQVTGRLVDGVVLDATLHLWVIDTEGDGDLVGGVPHDVEYQLGRGGRPQ